MTTITAKTSESQELSFDNYDRILTALATSNMQTLTKEELAQHVLALYRELDDARLRDWQSKNPGTFPPFPPYTQIHWQAYSLERSTRLMKYATR